MRIFRTLMMMASRYIYAIHALMSNAKSVGISDGEIFHSAIEAGIRYELESINIHARVKYSATRRQYAVRYSKRCIQRVRIKIHVVQYQVPDTAGVCRVCSVASCHVARHLELLRVASLTRH